MTDEVVAALAGGFVGGIIGSVGTYLGDRVRGRREREGDRRDFAVALVAEVTGWLSWWDQASEQCGVPRASLPEYALACIGVVGTESLFPAFDSAGPRLSLLPINLAKETVECYAAMKSVVDGLRAVAQAAEYASAADRSNRHTELINAAGNRAQRIVTNAPEVAKRVTALLEKLGPVATPR